MSGWVLSLVHDFLWSTLGLLVGAVLRWRFPALWRLPRRGRIGTVKVASLRRGDVFRDADNGVWTASDVPELHPVHMTDLTLYVPVAGRQEPLALTEGTVRLLREGAAVPETPAAVETYSGSASRAARAALVEAGRLTVDPERARPRSWEEADEAAERAKAAHALRARGARTDWDVADPCCCSTCGEAYEVHTAASLEPVRTYYHRPDPPRATDLHALPSAHLGEYLEWLRAHLAGGGTPTHYYDYPFAQTRMALATGDLHLDSPYGADSRDIIVPVGVGVGVTGTRGHCDLFYLGSGRHESSVVPVYSDPQFLALPGVSSWLYERQRGRTRGDGAISTGEYTIDAYGLRRREPMRWDFHG